MTAIGVNDYETGAPIENAWFDNHAHTGGPGGFYDVDLEGDYGTSVGADGYQTGYVDVRFVSFVRLEPEEPSGNGGWL
jgi:hypothetical protein